MARRHLSNRQNDIDRAKLDEEYWQAKYARLDGWSRIIANPRGAAAVKEVIDQIPRVKADLDEAEWWHRFVNQSTPKD